VENLLKSSIDGKSLLTTGAQTGGLLNEQQRKELGRIVVKHIVNQDPQAGIQSVTFSRLALQIKKLFPKEEPSVYFSPSLPASTQPTKRKKNASGILYEVYVNRRRKLREAQILPKKPRTSSRTNSCSSAEIENSPGMVVILVDIKNVNI
jgi:hypothetical protein